MVRALEAHQAVFDRCYIFLMNFIGFKDGCDVLSGGSKCLLNFRIRHRGEGEGQEGTRSHNSPSYKINSLRGAYAEQKIILHLSLSDR
jgi:hypothetical protein